MAERNPSDDKAAFGVFPQLHRHRAQQDREAAKNVPVDLARGFVSGVGGQLGDLEALVRMLPYLDEKTILPTSEDIEKRLPFKSDTPVSRAATGLGQLGGSFYNGRGAPIKLIGALPSAIKRGAEDFALASAAGAPHVIKPAGGNWLAGSIEGGLKPLRRDLVTGITAERALEQMRHQYTPEKIAALPEALQQAVARNFVDVEQRVALNKWLDSNLTNYIKKQMGTADDPVRKLAEEGIVHTPSEDVGINRYKAPSHREKFGGEQMGKTYEGKAWEDAADVAITPAQIKDLQSSYREPWMEKASPDTKISHLSGVFDTNGLGFDHIMDVLRQDLEAGRIRPDQLNKVSMEQAVRRTYEFDQELAKKMRETAIKQQGDFPVHKEYPEGYKWIELTTPKPNLDKPLPEGFRWLEPKNGYERLEGPSADDPNRIRTYLGDTKQQALEVAYARSALSANKEKILEDALKYEGNTMGHCVGGYCPDVLEGRTRIFSLRDTKGEPHVTVEVQPNRYAPRHEAVKQYMTAAEEEAKKLANGYTDKDVTDIATRMARENAPPNIVQIKGKQNAKPKEQYLPYVQDFVRGGKWGDVGDLKNTDLYFAHPEELGMYLPQAEDLKDLPVKRTDVFMRAKQSGLFPEGQNYLTRNEWEDILRKQYQTEQQAEAARKAQMSKPPSEGDIQGFINGLEPDMKRGGKVSISNNPDTMMLAVNNQKMAKGGKAVKFIEDVAPIAMDKLAMMFGNKLPLNMNIAEVENLAKRFPEPVVDRVNMAHKDVLKRTPELQEAAARIEAGDMSADEYARLVNRYKPVTPYETVPAPATREEILAALSKTSREAEGLPRKETYFGKPSSTLKEGDPVGLRLDIPSYNQANTWVVTAHGPRKSPVSGGAGTRIGYEPVAAATDVDFSVSPKAALGIAKGAEKNTIATMEGKWKPTSSDEAFNLAQQYLKHPEWRQVGMDPERHSFFYDRETMAPVVNAEEVIQIGPLVLAKNPKYGDPKDFKYAGGGDVHMADGGLSKLIRALPKSKAEIEAIAQRIAPQMLGDFVRADKGTQSVAGKTQKQFAKEKEMVHDIRPTGVERALPKPVDIEQLKGNVVIGIPGDPTISGQTLHSLNGIPLDSPSPQHGGPLYGLGRDDAFWASGLGAANRVQNLAREAGMQYDAPVLGKYIMMGPESINYAQHFADANLSAIDPSKMTKGQIESFNNLVRQGSMKSGPRPSFPGIENPSEAYLHFAIDPELRKHFNALMQMPTVTERHGLPSGTDVRHAITEPDLRDLETGITGKSIGRMRPEITELNWSEHPTYSHDIPGEFLGSSKYPIPYELSFPDTVRAIRENPKQAPHEFGSLKMVGPRQIIDQQMIDEIKQYEEQMKKLTGKAGGGIVNSLAKTEALAKLAKLREQMAPKAEAVKNLMAMDETKYLRDVTPDVLTKEYIEQEIARMKARAEASKPEVNKADGGAINFNTAPDMSDGGRIIEGAPFKRGGKVAKAKNLDTMFMELSNKKLKRK